MIREIAGFLSRNDHFPRINHKACLRVPADTVQPVSASSPVEINGKSAVLIRIAVIDGHDVNPVLIIEADADDAALLQDGIDESFICDSPVFSSHFCHGNPPFPNGLHAVRPHVELAVIVKNEKYAGGSDQPAQRIDRHEPGEGLVRRENSENVKNTRAADADERCHGRRQGLSEGTKET